MIMIFIIVWIVFIKINNRKAILKNQLDFPKLCFKWINLFAIIYI
jgi:hypothetical protein